MQKKYTIGQYETLKLLQDYYEYCSSSDMRKDWLVDYNRNTNYYNGNQWGDEELLNSLKLIGCDPKTFNHVKPACNDVISVLVRSGKRVGYLPNSEQKSHVKLAEYLKNWAFNVNTQNNHSYFSSLKVLSSLLGGIGWSQFSYDDGKFFYDYVDPREMFPDPDDLSPRLESSNVLCRSYFVNHTTLKNKYPKEKKYFEGLVEENKTTPDELYNDIFDVEAQTWVRGKSIRIVEVYYKKDDKFYETLSVIEDEEDSIGEEFVLQTFHEELAKAKSSDGNVEEKTGSRIYKGVFCNEVLLANGPIDEQIPNQVHFPIIPMVYQRDLRGKPIGILNDIISPQDMINSIMSTILHYTDSKTLIMSSPASDKTKFAEDWAIQSRRKSGILFAPDGNKDLHVIDNKQNVEHRLKVLQEVKAEIQSIMRIYDDFAGKATNRVSGVAIENSVNNNINAQNFLVLSYEHMIVSEGKLMFDTLKGINDLKQVFTYYKGGENKVAELDNTISMLNFEVYPETAPNFASSIEEEKAKFAEIINSPSRDLLLNSAYFLQKAGMSDSDAHKSNQEFLRIQQEQMQMQQGMMPEQNQEIEGDNNE